MKKYLQKLKEFWKLLTLFILILITFSYAMFQGGFVSWFLFYSFLPFALYGLGLSLYPLADYSGERKLPQYEFSAGEAVKAELQLKRRLRFPLFYVILEESMEKSLSGVLKNSEAKTILFPGFKTKLSYIYSIGSLPRGEHHIKGIRLKTGDPLGLIEKEKMLPAQDKILVYPPYEELIYRPAENQFDQGMTATNERLSRDTSMSVGVREYQPGDRFSWINWKATAKRNDFMTKEFEQRQSHDVMVAMDCAPEECFEAVVSFTASITRAILRKGAQAGLLTVSRERVLFPTRGGEAQQKQLFYHLAKITASSPVPFDQVLEGETFMGRQHQAMMLVTSRLTQSLLDKAAYYSRRNGSMSIFLIKGKKDRPTQREIALKASAVSRGIRVTIVQDGRFAEAFSEVNSR
ncbi:DUF58 domain-containing protein [Mesobacillus foraminis]|uniref:DUF58 domain-containing protein n=1 Tax=Mesobacillus foraminis TaxID=279826 RepID=UPI001BECE473|nr:DUF58 domain-containing protein [Mesobacillus foraminis]MBT2758109.1 DUF58 domain-containing protein [Mesobacillus foraminis]